MQHAFYKRQKGFTLLELLVVITLLAVLAVGALVAYEGVGDQAGATAAANNTATVDQSLRNYRAVTKQYPNQWDNIAASDTGDALTFLDDTTQDAFGAWNVGTATSAVASAVYDAFEGVGIEEVQQLTVANIAANLAPNLQHNEGSNPNSTEDDIDDVNWFAVMPSVTSGHSCTAGTVSLANTFDGPATAAANDTLNKINDSLETDTCHLVIALGFGHDAAHSTTESSVAIAQAPTHTSKAINPAENYARYMALFHLGDAATSAATDITTTDIKETPKLIAVVDPEGNPIDVNLMAANANN